MEDNFFGELLIAIQKHMATAVPEIKYMNIDLGQLEFYTLDSPSVSWPCLLVDFNDTNYSDLLEGVQEGEMMVNFRLGFAPFSQTSNLQGDEIKRLGLRYFSIENKVHAALHGWQPLRADGEPLCQPFYRRRASTERREEDAFRVRGMYFSTAFHDDGASPLRVTIQPDMELTDKNDELI